MTKFKYGILSLLFLLPLSLHAKTTATVHVRVEPQHFSPNNDGFQDLVFISPVVQASESPLRWRLEIRDAKRRVRGRQTGAGLSSLIKWDGLDRKGVMCADGDYDATVTVWGRGYNVTSDRKTIRLDTVKPTVTLHTSRSTIDASALNGQSVILTPSVVDDSPIERWQIQVMDSRGHTMRLFWSSGTVQSMTWDGVDQRTHVLVPKGRYTCVLQAWDKAGNESDPAITELEVNVSARDMLMGALKKIRVQETSLGLLVQLPFDQLFTLKNGKPILRKTAGPILDEVALLLNAYPGSDTRLEGYSTTERTAQKDRSLSSLYGWSVYSHLVKQGRVTPSRITVRGRGRLPAMERGEIKPRIVKNGVEVLLVGDGPW